MVIATFTPAVLRPYLSLMSLHVLLTDVTQSSEGEVFRAACLL